MNYYTYEIIQWLDSRGGGGWVDAENYNGGISSITTIGFIIDEDDKQITITSSIARSVDGGHYTDCLSIPKCCVTHRSQPHKLPAPTDNEERTDCE